jgi:hypothetical protein
VPKQIRDLLQRRALPQHGTGNRMTQEVSCTSGRLGDPGTTYGSVDKHRDGAVGSQASERCTRSQEELIIASRRTPALQVIDNRLPNFLTQGELRLPAALPTDLNCCFLPVDVLQTQLHDVARPQPQSGK